ncbi:MAG: hypothetical protein AAF958_10995 [Planctomycetota bacterium]
MLAQVFRTRLAIVACIVAATSIGLPADLVANDREAADREATDREIAEAGIAGLFPRSIAAFAKCDDLGNAVQIVLNHPLRNRIEALPAYQAATASAGYANAKLAIAGFENTMQMSLPEALDRLSDRGIGIGVEPSGGVGLVMQSSDVAAMEKFRNLLLAFLPKKDGDISAEQKTYRGVPVYLLKDLILVQVDGTLLICNQRDLGKVIIDRMLEPDDNSLAQAPNYLASCAELAPAESQAAESLAAESQAAADDRPVTPQNARLISAYVDLQAAGKLGWANDALKEKQDDFGAEVIFGGVLSNLRQTSRLSLSLDLSPSDIRLRLASPHQRDWEPPREYYFGEASAAAVAPPLIELNDRLFALSTHRDLSQLWLRSGDLLSDAAVDGLAKADSQLSTFFSGKDFGEDILGSLNSGIQIVGRVADPSEQLPRPAIQLPEFAMQFRLKDPAETQREFRRVFQSFIGFLNVVGAMNGNPQMDLGMETVKGSSGVAQLVTSSFVAGEDERESTAAPIQFNFSPTLGFAGDVMVLSSTTDLAKDLVAMTHPSASQKNDLGASQRNDPNTVLGINASASQTILKANQDQLIASNMLSKGQTRDEAAAEIGLLLEGVGLLKDFRVDLRFDDQRMVLSADLGVQP